MATSEYSPKKISIWRDERVLKIAAQIISSLIVFGFLYWMIGNFYIHHTAKRDGTELRLLERSGGFSD